MELLGLEIKLMYFDFKFQQILCNVEAKYQVEHERVRKWLEENDML